MTRRLACANYAEGRNAAKAHARGKIFGRVHVGLYEPEWRYLLELAKGSGSTMSDVIRWALESARETVEEEVFDDGEPAPWSKEMVLMQRFAHVEITNDE